MERILAALAVRLLTEKVIIGLSIHILQWLVTRTHNKLDDELLSTVVDALLPEEE